MPGFELRSPQSPRNLGWSGALQACLGLHPMWCRENNWSALTFLFWSQNNFLFLQSCRNSSFWVRLCHGVLVSTHCILRLWSIFSVKQTAQSDEKDCWRAMLWNQVKPQTHQKRDRSSDHSCCTFFSPASGTTTVPGLVQKADVKPYGSASAGLQASYMCFLCNWFYSQASLGINHSVKGNSWWLHSKH